LFLALYATDSPDAWLVRLASFGPLTAPFVIPVRAAVSSVPAWELTLAAAIMIASTYAVIRIAASVYEGAVLRAGPRLSVSDLWRAARAARARADSDPSLQGGVRVLRLPGQRSPLVTFQGFVVRGE
jgi:ABC-2 type transport system permease protein